MSMQKCKVIYKYMSIMKEKHVTNTIVILTKYYDLGFTFMQESVLTNSIYVSRFLKSCVK